MASSQTQSPSMPTEVSSSKAKRVTGEFSDKCVENTKQVHISNP